MMMLQKQILAYDIEVYSHDAFVVFKNLEKETVKVFSTREGGFIGLGDFIKDKILVGYNNFYYDDKILSKMINNWSAYQLKAHNDDIILRKYKFKTDLPCETLDVFQQIDVGMPSLKKIEGNMGKMILESSVDFNIGRPLTDEEYQECLKYCSYDVDVTIDIYKLREKSYFEPKKYLINMLGNETAVKWNTTTISANLLIDNPLPKWSWYRVPEWMMDLVPNEVVDLWNKKDKGKVTIQNFDCNIEFGFGGLHGVNKRGKRFTNVKLLDVTSLYPNIIIQINALGHATEKYKEILDRRVAVKHQDKVLSDALKLILNSVYGNLKNEYSLLNNPKAALSVCIYGQIALYELCKRLSKSCEIININTDGVAFITESDEYVEVWKQWEEDFNLNLEEDSFDLFIQKSVNDYIGVNY